MDPALIRALLSKPSRPALTLSTFVTGPEYGRPAIFPSRGNARLRAARYRNAANGLTRSLASSAASGARSSAGARTMSGISYPDFSWPSARATRRAIRDTHDWLVRGCLPTAWVRCRQKVRGSSLLSSTTVMSRDIVHLSRVIVHIDGGHGRGWCVDSSLYPQSGSSSCSLRTWPVNGGSKGSILDLRSRRIYRLAVSVIRPGEAIRKPLELTLNLHPEPTAWHRPRWRQGQALRVACGQS
jgi:hypothetical protein